MTICSLLHNSLFLQIDGCSRVIQTQSFLNSITGMSPQDVKNEYIGSIVMTRYGNNRTYNIEDILYDLNPLSTF